LGLHKKPVLPSEVNADFSIIEITLVQTTSRILVKRLISLIIEHRHNAQQFRTHERPIAQ
jgi:hypothetical protein